MKQLLQNMRDGKAVVTDVPIPSVRRGTALVRTAASLVSAGTERMVVEFAEKNLLGKAQSRPDLVRQVIDKARREGLIPTLQSALNRLDQPMALGYSSAGTIVALGDDMPGFKVGDRVACAGAGFAVHGEYGLVPANLLVKIPPQVDFESAAFTTIAAIALHGFRLAQPQLGERIAIIGLGLLGLITISIARAAGCEVFGVDLDPRRVELARSMGAQAVTRSDAESVGLSISQGRGFDAVLICADSKSNDPVQLAGILARDRARVVAVGAVGFNIPRKVYYEKELQFIVSRSYGPGRYDPSYEEGGKDYPIGYVRWTEGRNLAAVVDLLANGKLDVQPLISHRFAINDAAEAYAVITGKQHEPFLGVLLTYPEGMLRDPRGTGSEIAANRIVNPLHRVPAKESQIRVGVLGAGNYASAVFLPVIRAAGRTSLVGIASGSGLTAQHAAKRFGFEYACSSDQQVLEDPHINTVVILTRHNVHARQIIAALKSGKHVYCEKPLAISEEQLLEIQAALQAEPSPQLMVGFNRRFAPFAQKLLAFLPRTEPLIASYRVNAGYLPLNHWTQDPAQGGGRIIGEGCHFIDFLTFLVGKSPISVSAQALPNGERYCLDNVVITLTYPDGSLGTVTYVANGEKTFPKERIEVFCGGQIGILDDFRTLELVRNGHRQVTTARLGQDKGHRASWAAFLDSIQLGKPAPIPLDQAFAVTRATFAANLALQTGERVHLEG